MGAQDANPQRLSPHHHPPLPSPGRRSIFKTSFQTPGPETLYFLCLEGRRKQGPLGRGRRARGTEGL